MKRTWEQEKAYVAKRAEELRTIMNQAIAAADLERFREAHTKSLRYMPKKERDEYLRRFFTEYTRKENTK